MVQQGGMFPRRGKLVAYVDHPLGERDTFEALIARQENIESAGRWIRWLVEHTHLVVLVPWWPLVAVADEDKHRTRLMADQKIMIYRCADILVQCGDFVSPHMMDHERFAMRPKTPIVVCNLTQFSDRGHPPERGAKYQAALRALSKAIDQVFDFGSGQYQPSPLGGKRGSDE